MRAIQKRNYRAMYKTQTKYEAKRLKATILLSQSWKSDNYVGNYCTMNNFISFIFNKIIFFIELVKI